MSQLFDVSGLPLRKETVIKRLPPVPDTTWARPTHFPNIAADAKVLSFDVETKETDFDNGPGWARGKGHIVGFSLAAISHNNDYAKWYFPLRHEVEAHDNINPQAAFDWLRHTLDTPHIPKVGANLIYDIGWLGEENIKVKGDLHDVQFAEALLTENTPTNLEYLGQKYEKEGKDSPLLYNWCAEA